MDCGLHDSTPIHGRSAGHSTLESPGKTPLPLQNVENKGLITAGGCEALLIFVIFWSLMLSFLIHMCNFKMVGKHWDAIQHECKCIWVNQVSLGLEATSRGLIQFVILSGPLLRDGVSYILSCDWARWGWSAKEKQEHHSSYFVLCMPSLFPFIRKVFPLSFILSSAVLFNRTFWVRLWECSRNFGLKNIYCRIILYYIFT